MQTIYFENRRLCICRQEDVPQGTPKESILRYEGISTIAGLPVDFIANPQLNGFYIVADNPRECFDTFRSLFKQINAGGGLVKGSDGRYLMIFRNGHWDLPKGRQEDGEAIEECACREVIEETGLKEVRCGKLICETYHSYHMFGELCLKHTWWFAMDNLGESTLSPQTEEGITKAEWLTWDNVAANTSECFGAVREVILTFCEDR